MNKTRKNKFLVTLIYIGLFGVFFSMIINKQEGLATGCYLLLTITEIFYYKKSDHKKVLIYCNLISLAEVIQCYDKTDSNIAFYVFLGLCGLMALDFSFNLLLERSKRKYENAALKPKGIKVCTKCGTMCDINNTSCDCCHTIFPIIENK